MTEVEWLGERYAQRMLDYLRRHASSRPAWSDERKLRLLICAACRAAWDWLSEEDRSVVDVAERYADGEAGEEALHSAWRCANGKLKEARRAAARWQGSGGEYEETYKRIQEELLDYSRLAAETAARAANRGDLWTVAVEAITGWDRLAWAEWFVNRSDGTRRGYRKLDFADILRDLFGNPFRPAEPDPGWLAPEVIWVALSIYRDGAFGRLPELEEPLRRAGCRDQVFLSHCRARGNHVRGCWLLDRLLGKE